MDQVNKKFQNMARHFSPTAGFTLVELMVATAVSGIVMAAVMTSFLSQQNVYLTQGHVVEMQENARVAMNMLEMDIRSAGYDPNHLGAGVTTAGIAANGVAPTLTFTRDDGTGALETISYSLFDAYATTVPPRNDGLVNDWGRNNGGGLQPVAQYITNLEFRYLDGDGNPTSVLSNIRSIQVSILAQSAQPETKSYPRRDIYATPSGAAWQAPVGYWNLYLTTMLNCRNLGL